MSNGSHFFVNVMLTCTNNKCPNPAILQQLRPHWAGALRRANVVYVIISVIRLETSNTSDILFIFFIEFGIMNWIYRYIRGKDHELIANPSLYPSLPRMTDMHWLILWSVQIMHLDTEILDMDIWNAWRWVSNLPNWGKINSAKLDRKIRILLSKSICSVLILDSAFS